jgi:hypothetical protein
MSDERKPSNVEIYRPNEPLPGQPIEPRLPDPEAALPPGFPTTGLLRLWRLGSAMRTSNRYAAALRSLEEAYRRAAGVQDAQLELSRAVARLRDKDDILAADQANRKLERIRAESALEEERFRAEARKFLAELEMYRARTALEEAKKTAAQGATSEGQSLAGEDQGP